MGRVTQGYGSRNKDRGEFPSEVLDWTIEIETTDGEHPMRGIMTGKARRAAALLAKAPFVVTRWRIYSCEGSVIERLDPDAGWREVAA